MNLSAAGFELLKQAEGFRSHIYKDVAGVPTIGYGHRLLAGESFSDGLNEAQASQLLASDVKKTEAAVRRLVKVKLHQGQFDALVDFCFNLGARKLAGSTLLKLLNAGDATSAGQQLLLWDRAGQQVISGLKARREAELQLWRRAA